MLGWHESLHDMADRLWTQLSLSELLSLALVWSSGLPPLTGDPDEDAAMIELYYRSFLDY